MITVPPRAVCGDGHSARTRPASRIAHGVSETLTSAVSPGASQVDPPASVTDATTKVRPNSAIMAICQADADAGSPSPQPNGSSRSDAATVGSVTGVPGHRR